MNVTFTGGTDRERDLVRQALNGLLNFDLDLWNIAVEFEWVADPAAQGHNDLAATTTDGGGTAVITVRNDLDVYKGYPPSFYIETIAHELGHLLMRHLPDASKEAVAAMFGITAADIDNYDDAPPWEDRPVEGIAETFKDAFLPRRLRLFANRTNRAIPIHKYGAFRRIFREAEAVLPGFAGTDMFDPLDDYDPSLWAAGSNTGIYEAPSNIPGTIEGFREYVAPVEGGKTYFYEFTIEDFPFFSIWSPGVLSAQKTFFKWRFSSYFTEDGTPSPPVINRDDYTVLILSIDETSLARSGSIAFMEAQHDKAYSNGRHRITPAPIPNPVTGEYISGSGSLYEANAPVEWLPPLVLREEVDVPYDGFIHVGIEFDLQGYRGSGGSAGPTDIATIQSHLPVFGIEAIDGAGIEPQPPTPVGTAEPGSVRAGSQVTKQAVRGSKLS